MRFFEEYRCGCASTLQSKKGLPGYCGKHGDNSIHIYDQNGVERSPVKLSESAGVLRSEIAKSQ